MKLYILRVVLCLFAVLFIFGGVLLKLHILPAIIKSQIYENLDLREGTEGFNAFKEPPAPVYMNYHLFHISNPREMMRGHPPKLVEVGPYSYREIMRKESLMEQNSVYLSYGKRTEFIFDEENTKKLNCLNRFGNPCSKDDEVSVLNPVLLTIADLLEGKPEILTSILYDIINEGNSIFNIKKDVLVVTHTVDQILYSGFESNTAKILDSLSKLLPLILGAFTRTKHILKFLIPGQIAGGTFAFFKGRNDTKMNSYYTIENGRFDKSRFMNIIEFNGKNTLPSGWWPDVSPSVSGQLSGEGGSCHKIYGTDGTQFPPYLFDRKNFPLWMFVGELCRTIYVEFESEVEVEGGITTYRYGVGKKVFSMSNPENFCYCKDFYSCAKAVPETDGWDLSKCKSCKDGVLDVSGCYGAPIFMSQPHFLKADPEIQGFVEGLSPDPEKHSTYLDIEPHLGIPLRAHKKIQINLALKKREAINVMKGLNDFMIVPVFWADEGADLDADKAQELNALLFSPQSLGNGMGIALGYVTGPILLVIFLGLSIFQNYRRGAKKRSSEEAGEDIVDNTLQTDNE